MSARALLLAVLGVALLGLVAAPAFAEDGPADAKGAAKKEGEDAAEPPMTFDQLDDLFEDSPGALWTMLISRYGALLIGIILLALMYLRFDRIRGGALPAPEPNPPPLLFDPGTSVLLAVAGAGLLPFLISVVAAQSMGVEQFRSSTMAQIMVMGISTLPVAALVVLRRNRIAQGTVPPLSKAIGYGLGAFCIATVFVLPLTMLTVVVMQLLDQPAPVQDLVKETMTSPDVSLPIAITVYGVLIAPFAEESIFRGLLYPAVKRWLGDGRWAAISSAVLVSLVFAGVHGSWTAGPGLFALAMVLAYVYERTNSLGAVVVAHAVNNGLALIPILITRAS